MSTVATRHGCGMGEGRDKPLTADVRNRLARALRALGPGNSSKALAGLDERTLLRGAIGWPVKRSNAIALEAVLDRYERDARPSDV
jgi:hypothetical protein